MPFLSGLLGLGTSVVSGALVEPASGTGYSRAPISFDQIDNGILSNTVNCVFGPVLGNYGASPWGTLAYFQLFDQYGNPAWSGSLSQSVTPVVGTQINVPVGAVSITMAPNTTNAALDFNYVYNSQYAVIA